MKDKHAREGGKRELINISTLNWMDQEEWVEMKRGNKHTKGKGRRKRGRDEYGRMAGESVNILWESGVGRRVINGKY